MGVIFDLDQTLVDSSSALNLRAQRRWNDVYNTIPTFEVYEGLKEFIDELVDNDIPVCIVTSSPRSYCQKVLNYFEFNEKVQTICYHDTKKHKPDAQPMEAAIKLMECDKDKVVSIGDDIKDIQSSQSAGITSVYARWGIETKSTHEADYIFDNTIELINFLRKKYKIKEQVNI